MKFVFWSLWLCANGMRVRMIIAHAGRVSIGWYAGYAAEGESIINACLRRELADWLEASERASTRVRGKRECQDIDLQKEYNLFMWPQQQQKHTNQQNFEKN